MILGKFICTNHTEIIETKWMTRQNHGKYKSSMGTRLVQTNLSPHFQSVQQVEQIYLCSVSQKKFCAQWQLETAQNTKHSNQILKVALWKLFHSTAQEKCHAYSKPFKFSFFQLEGEETLDENNNNDDNDDDEHKTGINCWFSLKRKVFTW